MCTLMSYNMPFDVSAYDLHLTLLLVSFVLHKVINHQPYNQKADIFSFAIVLWELVTAKACPIVLARLNLYSFLSKTVQFPR